MPRRIEGDSHVPVFVQIVDHVRSAIGAGVYRPGESLPSLRSMAINLKVNPNTVQRAYDELCRLGLAESQRGRGVFVAPRGVKLAHKITREAARSLLIDTGHSASSAGFNAVQVIELFEESLESVLDQARTKQ